jgi:hypothetical protein
MKTTNKTNRILLSIIILCMAIFTACSKSDDDTEPTPAKEVDVYVSGYKSGTAVYWKNGEMTQLDKGIATDIAVSGNNVYLSGYENGAGSGMTAKMWENGAMTALSNGKNFAFANGVAVQGNTVYVVGNVRGDDGYYDVAKLWKNGSPIPLSPADNYANANGIYLQGNDVYIAGYEDLKHDSLSL